MGRGCECTVTLLELGAPQEREAAEAWCLLNDVTLVEDYMDRPAISVADAYKAASARRVAMAAAQAAVEDMYDLRRRVALADQERLAVLESAFAEAWEWERTHAVGRQISYPNAMREALKSVAIYDKGLDDDVKPYLAVLPQLIGWESQEGSK
jgi:hypothetical protein